MNKTSNRALIWDISDSVFVINIDQVFLLPGKLSKIDLFSDQEQWNTMSPLFNDVHVMVFLGIAFILTFLRGYRCGQTTSSTRKQIFCSEIGLFFFLICKKIPLWCARLPGLTLLLSLTAICFNFLIGCLSVQSYILGED